MNNAALGNDGMTKTALSKLSPTELACHFILWLATATAPSAFKKGIVTLIPKCAGSNEPKNYRPITILAIMNRLFHKVLADRLTEGWNLHIRQKAFQNGDELAANVWLTRALIQTKKHERKPLYLTFIDVEKALESVSHDIILNSAKRMGSLPILIQ